jgi:hypothetical protein
MQGIYTYIPETDHVPKEYNVAAILSLLFMAPISLIIIIIIIIVVNEVHKGSLNVVYYWQNLKEMYY